MCINRILEMYDLSRVTYMIFQVKSLAMFEILFYFAGIELLVIHIFFKYYF